MHISIGPNQDGGGSSDHPDRPKLPRSGPLCTVPKDEQRGLGDYELGCDPEGRTTAPGETVTGAASSGRPVHIPSTIDYKASDGEGPISGLKAMQRLLALISLIHT